MPATPPPKTTEDDSVTEVFTRNGVDYEVTVSAVNREVFNTDLYWIQIHHGRPFVVGKRASGDFYQKRRKLSRFVFPGEVQDNKVLDHIDQRPLNNVLSNLRVVSQQFNTMNATRKIRSEHGKGVTKTPSGKFASRYGKKQIGTFRTARIAKTARILYARDMGPEWEALETDIEMTEEEIKEARLVLDKPKVQRNAYGSGGVSLHASGLWAAYHLSVHFGYWKTEEGARARLDQARADHQRKLKEEDDAHMIPRTAEGTAYLTALRGEKVLVDDNIYLMMYRNKISVAADGYPRFKNRFLHRSVITESYNTRTHHTDHRNGVKLDNRRANLRIIPVILNTMNVKRSKYPGVLKQGDKFEGYVDNRKVYPMKRIHRRFKTAKEAYIWRCALHKKIYPECYE